MARANANERGLWQRDPRSDVWGIRYADEDGKEHRELIGTKSQARQAYQDKKREIRLLKRAPELAAAMRASVKFGELAADALVYCRRHANYASDEGRMKRMLEWWQATPATKITPQEIERRFTGLAGRAQAKAAGGTLNRYRSLLSLTYRLAQRAGKIPAGFNPARLVEPQAENKRVRWLTSDEERRLREVIEREYADKPWARVLDLALNCGLRWSDQRDLSVEKRDGDVLRLRIGKTGRELGLRLNPIAAAAWDELEAEASGGTLMPTKSPRHWFRRALALAGIEDFRWHDLRHTFATRLLEAGVPAEKVQQLLGHRTITMTLRYAHITAAYHDDALERLAEVNRRCASGGARVTEMPAKPPRRAGRPLARARAARS